MKYYLLLRTFFMLFLGILVACNNVQTKTSEISISPIPEIKKEIFHDPDSAVISKKAIELDNKFKRLVKTNGFNGTVLYAEKGRVILQKAYGYRNVRSKKEELTISDAFQLASISKMFSAMAIMILKNDGKVDYDENIITYLPDFPYEDVTLRLLMTHRAGLPRYMSIAHSSWKNKKIPLNNDDMLDLFVEYKPDKYFSPNTGFHYCNTNYALLTNIVESVSGMHFENFVEERIFIPLEMENSFVYNMRQDTSVSLYVEEGVPGYYLRGWRWREMTNEYLNGVMGDKNIYTSVGDLYKYDRALDNFTLLPEEIIAESFKRGNPSYWKRKNNYGFGWRVKEDMDSTVFHFGWWKGFRTFYIREMKYQKTLIVLTNKDKGPGSSHFWNIIKADTLPIGRTCEIKRQD
ncbi:MAG TPA: serine hydrolase domain-containing protein [Bacteroidales bacterium]|nr:serine hydrolase [Bacteroidota bacterium]MAE09458.1 serine hydrolase [Bacteroidota bacterium]HJN05007.1 serine hydrolase domain-containing protein [Bacteroidales bacterium]